ncbi:MAG: hypothetical protein ACI9VR_001720 [Cognaticolwellia sp.]|jgi:hypothetical protein
MASQTLARKPQLDSTVKSLETAAPEQVAQNEVQASGNAHGNSAAISALSQSAPAQSTPDSTGVDSTGMESAGMEAAAQGVEGAGGVSTAGPPPSAAAGGDGEGEAIFVQEIGQGGAARATEMYRNAPPGQRGTVEAAMRQCLGEEETAKILEQESASGAGVLPPSVQSAPGADAGTGADGEKEEGEEKAKEEGGAEQEVDGGGGGGGETSGANVVNQMGGPGAGTPEGQAAAGMLDSLPTSDLALVHQELTEHQRWGGAQSNVGTAGSAERASFIAEKAGEGAISGGLTGMGMGFAAGAIGKLSARFVPIPGVGAILGGAMSVYGLATRDWGKTANTVGNFGQGDSEYDIIANTIASVSEVIDLVCNIMNVIAGVIGVISAVMWIISIVTLGVASPLAATLSAIALGIGAASGILDLINNLILQPCVLLFRALHTFSSEADPSEVEAQGAGISDASGRAAGALGGWIGGKAGEAAGGAAGDAALNRVGGSADTPTTTTQTDAPTQVDAPTPVQAVDAPTPVVVDAPVPIVDAPTPRGVDTPTAGADGPNNATRVGDAQVDVQTQRSRGMAAIREKFGQHMATEQAALVRRNADIETARSRAQQSKQAEIEANRQQAHDVAETAHQNRVQEIEGTRPEIEATARQAGHDHFLAESKAAHDAQMQSMEQAGTRFDETVAAANQSQAQRQQSIDRSKIDQYMMDLEVRQLEAGHLADIADPVLRTTMERRWAAERSASKSQWETQHADQSLANAQQSHAEVAQASQLRQQDIQNARTQAEAARTRASDTKTQMVDNARTVLQDQVDASRGQANGAQSAASQAADMQQSAAIEAGNQAAQSATPGADATQAQTVADSKAELNGTRRQEGGRAVLDGMARARDGYMVQEGYRPDAWKKVTGPEGTWRHRLLDALVWPFMEDLSGPFLIKPRMNLDANGNPAATGPGAPVPMSAAGNASRGNERVGSASTDAAKAIIGGVDVDPGKENTALFRVVNNEPINPAYQEPPGSPEQLDVIMGQIDQLLAGRAAAEQAEQVATAHRGAHQANVAPITEAVTETAGAMSAQQAHDEAVARTQAANDEQKARQSESEGVVSGYEQQSVGLATIKGPLAAFRGFTWIASKIPGGAGRAMGRMNDDANKMNDAFGQMDSTMADQRANAGTKSEQLGVVDEVLTGSKTTAGANREQLDTAAQGAQGLAQANDSKVSEASSAEEEASTQASQLNAKAEEKKGEKATLKSQLVSWAQGHKAARDAAIAERQDSNGQ